MDRASHLILREQFAGHDYLSTACFHGKHDYCNSMVGYQGIKRPAQCKFCDARCICTCHDDERDTDAPAA